MAVLEPSSRTRRPLLTPTRTETALLHGSKDDMAVLRTEMATMELRIDDRMDERFRSMYG